ncbi:homologous-pairing protein-like protein 2 [Morchella conica CCBAS932]|uniref:Homologous-pairing protein-like protein 2 n=1 Tax=Morchella conica CCBAS932 TaxID=1392247 RepID=A0A3N4L8J5_9PEZI|nr:homologous-pairing protein-like protein 2 [Morchella conica CCBAS932]
MPPKKEKKEHLAGDQANELIIDYLRQQNRPYSATDVSANLHNAVTKTAAAKILKELHEKGEIEGRASGKQIVYHAIQDPNDFASTEDLKAMDEKITGTKLKIVKVKAELKSLQGTLNTLKAAPTVSSLCETVGVLETEIQRLESSLKPIRAGPIKSISASEKAAMDVEYVRLETLLRRRKKTFKEFWGTICDGCGDLNPSDLWERLGLEGDP